MRGGGGEEHSIDNKPLPRSAKGVSRGVEVKQALGVFRQFHWSHLAGV